MQAPVPELNLAVKTSSIICAAMLPPAALAGVSLLTSCRPYMVSCLSCADFESMGAADRMDFT